MQKIILIILALIFYKLNSQFLITLKHNEYNIYPTDIVNTSEKNFLIVTADYTSFSKTKQCNVGYRAAIYKICNNYIKDSIIFQNSRFFNILKLNEKKYLISGISYNQEKELSSIVYLLIDSVLNVITCKYHPLNTEDIFFYKTILADNKIISLINSRDNQFFKVHTIISSIYLNNIKDTLLFYAPYINLFYDIMHFKNNYIVASQSYLIFQYTNSASGCITYDSSFNIIKVDTIILHNCGLINISNKIYIAQEKIKKTYINKRDSNLILIKNINILPNTEKYNKLTTNRTIVNHNNYLYCLTTFDFQEEGFPYPAAPSYILVTKLDTSLNIIWQKIIGGDKNYISTSINVTNDGGCVVVGNMYDYSDTTIKRRDMFVLLLDSSGNIVNSTPLNNFNNHKYLIYPNPFYDELNIVFEKAYNNVILTLYNANGTTCFKDSFKKSANLNINLSYLKKGLYLFTLFIEDENTFYSGKIIKN